MFSFALKKKSGLGSMHVVCMGLRNLSHKKLCPVFFPVLCSTWLGLSVCVCKYSKGQRGCFPM